jgi:cell wall assembly regulator SMI1
LDIWLARNRPDYYAKLKPGLTDEDLTALENALNVTLPEEFRALYRWRNGQSTEDYEALSFRMTLLPADEILSAWETVTELQKDGMFETESHWNVRWVPFLASDSGDLFCVDTGGVFGGPVGQVIEFWHDDYRRWMSASSLRKWLEVLVTAFETGLIASVEEDPDQYEEDEEIPTEYAVVDEEAFAALRSRFDPGYPRFTDDGTTVRQIVR